MKNIIIGSILLLTATLCYSQHKITWKDLAKVTFTEKYFPKYKQSFLHPKFSSSVKALAGKLITIKGYFLNIDADSNIFILSKGPMASCFFCGIGGPETAIELIFKKTPTFKTDTIVAITGVLKLNQEDVEHFNYILTNCVATVLK